MERLIKIKFIVVGVLILLVVLFFMSDFRIHIYNYFSGMGLTEFKISTYRFYNLIVMLFVMTFSALIGNRISIRKKRNQTLWTVLCFIFNIWAVIILWFLPVVTNRQIKEVGDGVEPP